MRLPKMQRFVNANGKHIGFGEQHELEIHTELFDVQVFVILSHGSKMEHRMAGAQ
jgi:hypothetical protein